MNTLIDDLVRSNASNHAASHAQRTIAAGLSYLKPTTERPHSYTYEPPPGAAWESGEYALHQMPIADARHAPVQPDLECEGFALMNAPTAVQNFLDGDEIRVTYYREASELVLAATGASRAYVFDHLVRRRERGRATLTFGRREPGGPVAANGRVHNDYTEDSGRRRLGLVVTDPNEAAGVRRFAIVNVWRSIKGPIVDTPLALCDARTLMASDLVVGDVHYPQRTGEIYLPLHSRQHRWSYFSEMDRHEALVFKQYDSQLSGVARFTPHAAFDLPDVPPDAPLRESIELRCLVTYEDKE